MATQILDTLPEAARQDGLTAGGFIDMIARAFAIACEGDRRLVEIRRLHALSDADLATLGLEREEIARHVFKDVFETTAR